jgi:hypothetical protein
VISRVDRFNNHTCWDVNELDEDNIYRKFFKITKYTQQVNLVVFIYTVIIDEAHAVGVVWQTVD